jgi:hypothetical protein
MDQWTRTLSKIAPQSHKCVKNWSILLSEMVLDWLYRPTAGHLMRQQPGHLDCQITQSERFLSSISPIKELGKVFSNQIADELQLVAHPVGCISPKRSLTGRGPLFP